MNKEIRNLGGWLAVLQIGLFLNFFSWLKNTEIFYSLYQTPEVSQSTDMWKLLFVKFGMYSAFFFTAFSLIAIWYLFKRKKFMPKLLITYAVLDFVHELAVYILFRDLAGNSEVILWKILLSGLVVILLTGYLLRSVRVKMTFIN